LHMSLRIQLVSLALQRAPKGLHRTHDLVEACDLF
jgi:hypothetical protein